MTPLQLQRLREPLLTTGEGTTLLPQPRSSGPEFADSLKEAVGRVDSLQKAANQQITSFVAGGTEDLHEVMIAMKEAEMAFQLMTEVRNKMLETYQELMRMQV